jgi:hypothetical protein
MLLRTAMPKITHMTPVSASLLLDLNLDHEDGGGMFL